MDETTSRVLVALLGALTSCVTAWVAAYYDRKRRQRKRRYRLKPKEG